MKEFLQMLKEKVKKPGLSGIIEPLAFLAVFLTIFSLFVRKMGLPNTLHYPSEQRDLRRCVF